MVLTAARTLVFVIFWVDWLDICKQMELVVMDLERYYVDKVLFINVDADKVGEVILARNVTYFPTIHFYHNGILVDKLVGLAPRQELEEKIKLNLLLR